MKTRCIDRWSGTLSAIASLVLVLACASTAHGQANCPGANSCCTAHANPGCNNTQCCQLVCAFDPFCCAVQWDAICVGDAQDVCPVCGGSGCAPDCNKQNVECLNPSLPNRYVNRTFVAQLRDTSGTPYCTAWVVAAPDCMLTANHCAPAVGEQVVFNLECSQCVGGAPKPTTTFTVTQVLGGSAAQDWRLFRVNGNVAALFGQAEIDPSPPVNGEGAYEIHHSGGLFKGYDPGNVTAFPVNACVSNEMAVTLIAAGGASGSPVFRASNDCVFGYCNCGPPCGNGQAVPLSVSWNSILSAINSAGCTPIMCGQGDTEAALTSLAVPAGTLISGGLAQLALADNAHVVIDSVTQGTRNNVLADVFLDSPFTTVSQLDLRVEVGPADASPVFLSVALFDYDANAFVTLSFGSVSTTNDTIKEFLDLVNPNRFINNSGEVRVRVGQTARLSQTPAGFTALLDEVEVLVTP